MDSEFKVTRTLIPGFVPVLTKSQVKVLDIADVPVADVAPLGRRGDRVRRKVLHPVPRGLLECEIRERQRARVGGPVRVVCGGHKDDIALPGVGDPALAARGDGRGGGECVGHSSHFGDVPRRQAHPSVF